MATQKGASDVHLKAGIMPVIRRHGMLRPLASNLKPMSGESIEEIAYSIMDGQQIDHFKKYKEVDLAYGVSGLGRFRVSVFRQRGTIRMVIRNIPHKVPVLDQLLLPEKINDFTQIERGLVLVTGATGMGKSTTLAAIIDQINRSKNKHILTIEDPIEFLIRDRKSIITQRELGVDTTDFSLALRAALRQDPDVILIGEMRDRETIEIALLAAETGHLVFSTLHTLDATETINRIIAAFEPAQQTQVRMQLSSVLRGVVSQRLARRKDKKGFVPAVEILVVNERVKELIDDPVRTKEIREAIQESHETWGMQSFDQSLMGLLTKDLITMKEALALCTNPEDFKLRYSGIESMDGKHWDESSGHKKNLKDAWSDLEEVELDLPPEMKAAAKKKKSS